MNLIEVARRIVEAEKLLYPGCEDCINGSRGKSSSDTDTGFERSGTSTTSNTSTLPSGLASLVGEAETAGTPSAALSGQQSALFSSLLTQDPNSVPGAAALTSAIGINPTSYDGQTILQQLASRDPFSGGYEADTADAYGQRAGDALSQVQSGHEAVRGGQSRSGIAQGVMADRLAQGRGEEVRKAQLQDAQLGADASKTQNVIELGRRGIQLQGQQQLGGQAIQRSEQGLQAGRGASEMRGSHNAALDMAARLLGSRVQTVLDALTGKGVQSTSSHGSELNILGGCCFIFLESLNGSLPWYMEVARREYYTPLRRRGYKWMSNWLVPAMRRKRWVRLLVNGLIVKPFLTVGAWNYGVRSGGRWLRPYCRTWLAVWGTLGRFVKGEVD